MDPLLKRILVNGTLTAVTLAVIGVGYAGLAGLFLAAKSPMRATVDAPAVDEADPMASSLQTRVPLMMAAWGFLFIALVEVFLHRFRRRRPPEAESLSEPKVDAATALLEEILAKVEAERATPAPGADTSASPALQSPHVHT